MSYRKELVDTDGRIVKKLKLGGQPFKYEGSETRMLRSDYERLASAGQ